MKLNLLVGSPKLLAKFGACKSRLCWWCWTHTYVHSSVQLQLALYVCISTLCIAYFHCSNYVCSYSAIAAGDNSISLFSSYICYVLFSRWSSSFVASSLVRYSKLSILNKWKIEYKWNVLIIDWSNQWCRHIGADCSECAIERHAYGIRA